VEELQGLVAHLSTVGTEGAAVSMAIHEVAQPVTAATNFLAAAEELLSSADPAANDRGLEAVHFAQECLTRTSEVMATVKDAAEMKALDASPQAIRSIVNEAIRMFEFEAAFVPLINIPSAASQIMGDRVQLRQVIANLIRNAMEASEGQVVRVLRIGSRIANDGLVEIRIEDNGPGISDKMRGLLFSPFSSTKTDGAGVGLSICRTIIEQHGGRIWAAALPEGTAFCFTVPVCDASVKLPRRAGPRDPQLKNSSRRLRDVVGLVIDPAQAA
jgi:two-component system sensor kinase FixL